MTDQIMKAKMAIVKVGLKEFDGLMFEDDSFGIAVTQVCNIFLIPKDHSSRDFKAMLGDDFQFSKARTKLNPKAVNVLQLTDFEILIRRLSRKGNLIARQLTDDLMGLALTQLFSDGFGVKFEKEERQGYIANSGKVFHRRLTDVIKEWCEKNECSEKAQAYCVYCTNEVNKMVFGITAKELKKIRGVSNTNLLRNKLSSDELRKVKSTENKVIEYIICDNMKPKDAVRYVAERQRLRQQLK